MHAQIGTADGDRRGEPVQGRAGSRLDPAQRRGGGEGEVAWAEGNDSLLGARASGGCSVITGRWRPIGRFTA